MPRIAAFALAALAIALPMPALAQSNVNCAALVLTEATGVPDGSQHSYKAQGICELGGSLSNSLGDQVIKTWVYAEARWEKSTGLYVEDLTLQGDVTGKVHMSLRCGKDPLVAETPCIKSSLQNKTPWSGFEFNYLTARPLLKGAFTLAEATELSGKPTLQDLAGVSGAIKCAREGQPSSIPGSNRFGSIVGATGGVEVSTGGPPKPGFVLLPKRQGQQYTLARGRRLVLHLTRPEWRWALEDSSGAVLRLFVAEATAWRNRPGEVLMDSKGKLHRLGRIMSDTPRRE